MALGAFAIIVITIAASAFSVTILIAFSQYLGGGKQNDDALLAVSREQDMYMRQVRQRNYESAYSESVGGSRPPTMGTPFEGDDSQRSSYYGATRGGRRMSNPRRGSSYGAAGGQPNSYNNGNNYSGGHDEHNYSENNYSNGKGYDYRNDGASTPADGSANANAIANPFVGDATRPSPDEKLPTTPEETPLNPRSVNE